MTEATGEAVYLRDDETERPGVRLRPMRRKRDGGRGDPSRRRRDAFRACDHGIRHELRDLRACFATRAFALLTLANHSDRPRRLSAFGYNEWALSPPRPGEHLHVRTEWDADSSTVLAQNPYNQAFGSRVAFAHAGELRSASGDRLEFLGRNGTMAQPAALGRTVLSNAFGAGSIPAPRFTSRSSSRPARPPDRFSLGQGEDRDAAVRMVKSHGSVAARSRPCRGRALLDQRLGAVEIHTGRFVRYLMNRWLLYQSISSRCGRAPATISRVGRSDSATSSGRDGAHLRRAELYREHLLRAASRQFVEGAAAWGMALGAGFAAGAPMICCGCPTPRHYVAATEDRAVLDERAPFLVRPTARTSQHEAFGRPDTCRKMARSTALRTRDRPQLHTDRMVCRCR